jgi:hypothetical protein
MYALQGLHRYEFAFVQLYLFQRVDWIAAYDDLSVLTSPYQYRRIGQRRPKAVNHHRDRPGKLEPALGKWSLLTQAISHVCLDLP